MTGRSLHDPLFAQAAPSRRCLEHRVGGRPQPCPGSAYRAPCTAAGLWPQAWESQSAGAGWPPEQVQPQVFRARGRSQGFPGGSVVKNTPATQAMQETRAQSLGREDLLKEEIATHCNPLVWRISWTEEPGGLLIQYLGVTKLDLTEHGGVRDAATLRPRAPTPEQCPSWEQGHVVPGTWWSQQPCLRLWTTYRRCLRREGLLMRIHLTLSRLTPSPAWLLSKASSFTYPSQMQGTESTPGCCLSCLTTLWVYEGAATCKCMLSGCRIHPRNTNMAMDWRFVSALNFYVKVLKFPLWWYLRWDLWEVIRFKWSHECESSIRELVPL